MHALGRVPCGCWPSGCWLTGLAVLLLGALGGSPARGQDFWKHWGDGRAELNGYELTEPRYGAPRSGSAVLVFVTEDFSDERRVKAEGKSAAGGDVYPVMKLNHLRDFQTGIYDYSTMTSVFARVEPGWPVRKVSFSSREWCGHVWHQLLPGLKGVDGVFHSYFEGEADGRDELPLPAGGVFEDALPILLRGWNGEYLRAGESRTVPFLRSLFSRRMLHNPLAWGRAAISRSASVAEVKVPAGTFKAVEYTVIPEGGAKTTWTFEAAPPWRLLRLTGEGGLEASLRGSTRQPYWRQNAPGGEAFLKELGLKAPSRLP
jgi:hypothetical protein